MKIQSTIIGNAKPNPTILRQLAEELDLDDDSKIRLMVLQIQAPEKTVYACLSGGLLVDHQIHLTNVGMAAVDALMSIPSGSDSPLIFQELKLGKTPLPEKIERIIDHITPNGKVCLFGDMSGELDGHIIQAINLQPGEVNV